MLKPKYLEQLPDSMIELFSQAEQDILADMARRISKYDYWIPSVEHQRKKLVELGNFHSFILKALSSRTGKTEEELKRLMQEAGQEALSFDIGIYEEHGLDPPPLAASKTMQAVLTAGYKKTAGLFRNLTSTTANTATKQFENTLDRAYMQITTGAFDYNTAIRSAVKDLARQGVGAVQYPSGHVDTIEVAVRRAVVTGVNQTALQLQSTLADEMGCDLVETTAHAGARPEHAVWQGKVFSRSGGSEKYPDFVKETGYGTGPGLGGWNCRHSFFPYFEGSPRAYTPEMLAQYGAEAYTYNGKAMTEYEATQQQRYIERQIRRWKREYTAMDAAGLDTSESAAKIRSWQERQKDFLKQTGLKRQSDRENPAGWGHEQANSVLSSVRKFQRAANALFDLGSDDKNLEAYLKEKTVIDTLEAQGVKYKQRISIKEIVVDTEKPIITGMRGHAVDNLANKADRAEMTQERAQAFVDAAKLIVYRQGADTLKFMAQDGYAVLNFDHELVTAVPQKWRRKFDQYLEEGESVRRPNDKHDCPLLGREVLWGECWIVQDIRDDNTDMEFAPEPFDLDKAAQVCEKCRWCYVNKE